MTESQKLFLGLMVLMIVHFSLAIMIVLIQHTLEMKRINRANRALEKYKTDLNGNSDRILSRIPNRSERSES